MLFKVGVQFVNGNGTIGSKIYSYIVDSSELKKLNKYSFKTTYKIISGDYIYDNQVIFVHMSEPTSRDISTYTKITCIQASCGYYLTDIQLSNLHLVQKLPEFSGLLSDSIANIMELPIEATMSTISETVNTTKSIIKKESNNMKKIFGTYFGKFNTNSLAMSIYGIAVKDTTGRYVTYKNSEIIDVSEFIIPNMNYFFAMPTAITEIRVRDIILHQDKPMMCINGNEDGSIRAIDFTTSEIKDIMPKKNPFGFNFVTKIICPFGENSFMMDGFGADSSNPFGNMLPMMMLMGEKDKGGANDNNEMMMMAMMMSGGHFDLTSNPMLMYMMMSDGESAIDPMMLMLMMQNKGAECKCECKKNDTPAQ